MTEFFSTNPRTGQKIRAYPYWEWAQVEQVGASTHTAMHLWARFPLEVKLSRVQRLGQALRAKRENLIHTMGLEMGKDAQEAGAEVDKCADLCDYYVKEGVGLLTPLKINADGLSHEIQWSPLGVVLSIMPWNYPLWQVIRFAVPTLLVGNGTLLKHSDYVPETAKIIEGLFFEAGFPENLMRAVFIDHTTAKKLIESSYVQAVSLTGSPRAGAEVAAIAGRVLKKCVLELGGSDPFIVLEDADLKLTTEKACLSRLLNCGQSCVSAKRFFVQETVFEPFLNFFIKNMKDRSNDLPPLVSESALRSLESQLERSIQMGARVVFGGKRRGHGGYFFEPTVVVDVTPSMPLFNEEVFGPIAPVMKFQKDQEAVKLANDSQFGLGASVWTKNMERGKGIARQLLCGMTFINGIVKSDPRMPFGGIKQSGFGRELSTFGLAEFANIKTLNVY